MKALKFTAVALSLLLALTTISALVNAEMEKAEAAQAVAESEINTANEFMIPYTVYSFGKIFSDVLFGGNETAQKYARTATEYLQGRVYYSPEDQEVIIPGEMMAYMSSEEFEKLRKATPEEIFAHFQETAWWSIAELRDPNRSYGFLAMLFIVKLLAGLGASAIPVLLSLFAEPVWLIGLLTAFSLLAAALAQTANAQSTDPLNLLKITPQWQAGERSTSAVLFRFWPHATAYLAATPSGVSLGGGPTWNFSDSLRNFQASVTNALSLDHDGSSLASFKLWNIAKGSLGKIGFYSKSFASFPTWKYQPQLILSVNQLTYQLRERISAGWRTEYIFSRLESGWQQISRQGPVVTYRLSDRLSALLHYAPVGNSPAVTVELNVVF